MCFQDLCVSMPLEVKKDLEFSLKKLSIQKLLIFEKTTDIIACQYSQY